MASSWIEQQAHYCTRCGTQNPHLGTIPFHCPSCGLAVYFGPVAAVGALIVNAKAELLFVRRARDPGLGKWGLPGGFVDRGESAEQALSREVLEETGLHVESMQYLITYPNQYEHRGVVAPVIDLFYQCEIADGATIELEFTELDHFEWAKPSAKYLDNMAFDSNRKAIEVWLTRL